MNVMKDHLRQCKAAKWGKSVTRIVEPVNDAFAQVSGKYNALISHIDQHGGANNADRLELDTHIDLFIQDKEQERVLERFEQTIDEAEAKLKRKYL